MYMNHSTGSVVFYLLVDLPSTGTEIELNLDLRILHVHVHVHVQLLLLMVHTLGTCTAVLARRLRSDRYGNLLLVRVTY